MDNGLRRVFGERFGLPMEGYPRMTTERAKQAALTSLAEPDQYAEHILNKTWLLFETSAETPFYISDNPVALQNEDKSRGPMRGTLGACRARHPDLFADQQYTDARLLLPFARDHDSRRRSTGFVPVSLEIPAFRWISVTCSTGCGRLGKARHLARSRTT